jgi:(1->4)-alpha-D-glucan 1-alpha-D-glucosylmutase
VTSGLHELARSHGIALNYRDIWGVVHEASPDTLVALLGAMHVDAHNADAIEAALRARASAQNRQVLPPAWGVEVSCPSEVPVRLAGSLAEAALAWRLQEEDGRERRMEFHPAELRELERTPEQTPVSALPLPGDLREGYHRLSVEAAGRLVGECLLIAAPTRCHQPDALADAGRVWGVSCQLYSLRSGRNWGVGDFTDLAELVALCGARGAGLVGVNPLHAMFGHNPAHASPYSPSSRLFLNTLYLDVEAAADFRECKAAREFVASAAFQTRLQRLRDAERVDYVEVAAAKREVLERLYAHFVARHIALRTERATAFAQFRVARGEALRRHALFEALQEHLHSEDPAIWGWPVWPQDLRSPEAPAVKRFARESAERVGFFEYLQWLAELQLASVARRARESGLGIGLYVDLAVSIDRAGAEAWSEQSLHATDATIGAPPDDYNLKGQDWGLPPLIPERLAAAAFAPFIATLRANMRHAGALRIDHVMALMRLYWIATGAAATQGAYVHYPFNELLAIVRLESKRQRCLVVGEDLGTVPPAVREQLAASGVLSYRLLYFERTADGGFKPASQFAPNALVAAATHDLPTLAGWWEGSDIELRAELGLLPDGSAGQTPRSQDERALDRSRLLQALQREGLLPAGLATDADSIPCMTDALALAVHRHLARSPAKIVLVQLEDVLGERAQANLPGTTDAHPNWQRKLSLPLERWAADPRIAATAATLTQERGGARQALIPRATYRVQLHRAFRFADATALVPYLAQLGISHLYCSPFLRARAGSMHGYDVVDHGELNPEIGTRAELEELVATLRRHSMGLLVDLVPNHMGVLGGDNAWWLDVLEHGQASPYAEYFDIDWAAADPALAGRVMLPILGDQYGVVLERGEIRLLFEAKAGCFVLVYREHRLPIDPASYGGLIRRVLQAAAARALPAEALAALATLAASFEQLPSRDSGDEAARTRRRAAQARHKAQLARAVADHLPLARAVESELAGINGNPGARASFDALDALLDAQAYRLTQWRVAADQINYRRFFDINELAALHIERPEVFAATHRLILELAADRLVDGVRIDHPDGLLNPAEYFRRLQARYADLTGGAVDDQSQPARRLYVVIEKIVAPHEQVPRDWAVHGTTGYRFANVINGVLIESAAKLRLERIWRAFVRDEAEDFDELAWRCRQIVMDGPLSAELTVLATALLRLARGDRRTRDFTFNSLRRALAAVVASFPVYRTYIVDKPSAQDRRFVDWAIGRARRRSLAADASVFDFLRRVLLGRPLPGAAARLREGYREFAHRLQQYTAPVAAKGIEDTALFRHHRLISVNEVGGDPDAFGFSVAAFHGASRDRAQHWPHTLLATSTHDTKRSEDVRARIDVISEMPAAWRLTVRRWSRMNRRHRRTVDGAPAPTRNDEYLLYQTLVGSLPPGPPEDTALADFAQRIEQAMLKSARESKSVTSWINPNSAYESALSAFVHALLEPRDTNLFLQDLVATAPVIAWFGALNGITLTAVKCLSPGVPDFYQGHEAIELSLLDPDNRRPVDYARRLELLERAQRTAALPQRSASLAALLARATDGEAKFWTTWCALQLRREHETMLKRADYLPLQAQGAFGRHVLAFARHADAQWIIVVATRLFASLGLKVGELPLGAVWGDTVVELPADLPADMRLQDAIGGRTTIVEGNRLLLASLLHDFPVALLAGSSSSHRTGG